MIFTKSLRARIAACTLAMLVACFGAFGVTSAYADAVLDDGVYQIDVTLSGGSGKASVASPATLEVQTGSMTATLEWSSPYYDLMVVDGQKITPEQGTGTGDVNSQFKIPVSALDEDLAIQAETTAMSEPHMIDYTLHFTSSSAQAQGHMPSWWPIVMVVVIVVLFGAGMLITRKAKK
jgi:hypothetical protein